MAYPVSDAFKEAVKTSHIIKTRVDILVDEVVEYTLETMTEGQVTADFEQDARTRANFTAVDENGTLTPLDAQDLLTPYGNEFACYRGVLYPDGSEEMVPLGIFGITSSEIQDNGPEIDIRCEGIDRSARIKRSKFRDTFTVPSGASIPEMLNAIMGAVGTVYPTRFTPMEEQTTAKLVYDVGGDPWAAMQQLARTCACDLRFAHDGVLELIQLPSYNDVPFDWEFSDGDEGVLLAVSRSLSQEDVPNWIIVTGENTENTTAIPRGEAFDDDPNSPTYVFGKYGIVTKHVQDRGAVNDAQAAQIAMHELQDQLGLVESVTGYFVCNPAVQVLDLVNVHRERAKLDNVPVIIDQVSHPLVSIRGSQGMTRRRAYLPRVATQGVLPETLIGSLLVYDSFTGADIADLSGRITEVGGKTWVHTPGTGAIGISGNAAYASASSSADGGTTETVPCGTADVDITIVLGTTPTTNSCGISFRVKDVNEKWVARINATTSILEIFKVNGSTTSMGTFSPIAPVTGDRLRLVCKGNDISFYYNDVLRLSVTDSTFNTMQDHGVMFEGTSANGRIDSITIRQAL